MKMSLTVQTDDQNLVKARPKAFRRLKEGETVDQYFDFGDQLHDGGTRGKVLKAFRRTDWMEVVVKVRAKRSDKASERAWREVMTQLHNMRHQSPHVLDIFEILEDDKHFFVVMPMCEGGELFNFLVTEAEVPESECKRIIREILRAVGHLHENNLIHRDVKPENILFDIDKATPLVSPKTVKLIDFDTCMEWTPTTPKIKSFVGTPGYIAPEALLGEASPQSDLWSIGVICYILMTGETPWTTIDSLEDGTVGSAGATRMYNTLKNAVVDWSSDPWPDFPLARDLCQKLMAFDTEERPMSVSEALAHPWLAK
jgi:serine/threonine protein kinase